MCRMIIGSLFCVLTLSQVVQASIIYTVDPVTLSDGADSYNLTGFIETDGTIGNLMNSNIVDYEIQVTGPVPYTFDPTNPGASIWIQSNTIAQGLSATADTLSVVDADGTASPARLRFVAEESTVDCLVCEQFAQWFVSDTMTINRVTYAHRDFDIHDPPQVTASLDASGTSLVVARVPEPNAFLFTGLVALGVLAFRHLKMPN